MTQRTDEDHKPQMTVSAKFTEQLPLIINFWNNPEAKHSMVKDSLTRAFDELHSGKIHWDARSLFSNSPLTPDSRP